MTSLRMFPENSSSRRSKPIMESSGLTRSTSLSVICLSTIFLYETKKWACAHFFASFSPSFACLQTRWSGHGIRTRDIQLGKLTLTN